MDTEVAGGLGEEVAHLHLGEDHTRVNESCLSSGHAFLSEVLDSPSGKKGER